MIQCAVSWQCHALQQKQRALPRGRRAERIGGAASAHRVHAGNIDVREAWPWAARRETSSTAAWNCPCNTAAPSAVTRPVLPAWPQLVDRLAGLVPRGTALSRRGRPPVRGLPELGREAGGRVLRHLRASTPARPCQALRLSPLLLAATTRTAIEVVHREADQSRARKRQVLVHPSAAVPLTALLVRRARAVRRRRHHVAAARAPRAAAPRWSWCPLTSSQPPPSVYDLPAPG